MAENFEITSQNVVRDFGPGNRIVESVEIDFLTPEGAAGRVRIPVDRYTPEHVFQETDALARTMRSVHNL